MSSQIGGRNLRVTNRDKVFWPSTGFTKGQLLDYYEAVAGVMVPHLVGRPITLRRWPDGVAGQTFFQKNAPRHRPEWMGTVRLGEVDYLRIDEPAALVWAANLAAIEIHPGLAPSPHLDRPAAAVFDLDPGPPADLLTCCRVAQIVRGYLERLGLRTWPKTSGSKGLQLYVPLNTDITYASTQPFGRALAQLAESEHPDLVTSTVERDKRHNKVLIDWAQNAPSRTTVAAYSVRAVEQPRISTPVTWEEIGQALERGDADRLRFSPEDVLARIEERGDLMAPVLEVRQELPALRN